MKYDVYVMREFRVKFTNIEADSKEQAALIAARMRDDQAELIDGECDGSNLAALVDVVGDEEYEQSELFDWTEDVCRRCSKRRGSGKRHASGLRFHPDYFLGCTEDEPLMQHLLMLCDGLRDMLSGGLIEFSQHEDQEWLMQMLANAEIIREQENET